MERVDRRGGDLALVLLTALLVGFGVAMLYSASYSHAGRIGRPATHFVQRQAVWVLLGVGAAVLASWTPLELIRAAVPPLLIATFVLLLLPFAPGVGESVMGARRWIFIGDMSFQPSELAKLTIVLYVSALLSKKQDRLDDAVNGILPPLIVVLVFSGLILMQNNFSTAVFLFFVALAIFFAGEHSRIIHLALIASLLVPLALMLLFTREHRLQRIVAFLDPMRDPAGASFQVLQARTALAAGGLWGRGLGLGSRKLGALPEAHSDFIFAVVGEELGLLGMLGVLVLFVLLAARGYAIAAAASDPFARYVAFGVTTILFQALLNMAVVSGLAPATGVPLPFFSNGGSSMLVSLAMVGLLVNVSRSSAPPRRGGLADV